ncbi:MAG: TPM domain-containing protein [Steroidobacteraceae bacterium]
MDLDFRRLLRHLFTSPWAVRQKFPASTLQAIEAAIANTERLHGGELRCAIEGSLDGPQLWNDLTPRERASEVFSMLRMWDTEANSGVLIYVLLADHAVEIIADRGYGDISKNPDWLAVCKTLEGCFSRGDFEGGAVRGIEAIGKLIALRFPAIDRDELPNATVLL